MAPITATTEVDSPPAEVSGYVTDPTRFVEWQRNVICAHRGRPAGVQRPPATFEALFQCFEVAGICPAKPDSSTLIVHPVAAGECHAPAPDGCAVGAVRRGRGCVGGRSMLPRARALPRCMTARRPRRTRRASLR